MALALTVVVACSDDRGPLTDPNVTVERFLELVRENGAEAGCTARYLSERQLSPSPSGQGPRCDTDALRALREAKVVGAEVDDDRAVVELTEPATELVMIQAELPWAETVERPLLIWQIDEIHPL